MFALLLLLLVGSARAHRPFLSFSQKAQVLWTGTVTDADGNRYNIRILPGYAPSFGFGTDSWGSGWDLEGDGVRTLGSALLDYPKSFLRLREYGTAEPWDGIGDGFGQGVDMSKWAFTDMMTAGVARDWHEYMSDAAKTVERESFGWWLAYPWAAFKGAVNATLRQGIGVVVIASGIVWALAIRPTFQLGKPLVLTAWDFTWAGGETVWSGLQMGWGLLADQIFLGTATPLAGLVWNSALGLPMALLGTVPTPRSVDGWWVSQISGIPDASADGPTPRGLVWDGSGQMDTVEVRRWVRGETIDLRREQLTDSINGVWKTPMQELRRRIDSLETVRWRLERIEDSTKSAFQRSVPTQVDPPRIKSWSCPSKTEELSDSLLSTVENLVRSDSLGSILPDDLVQHAVHDIDQNWGGCLEQPSKGLSDPRSKMAPTHLIRDETQQILNGSE
jgi:hypothetical protein